MNKLKLILIIQLIFFTGWGIYLLTSVDPNASDIYLETEPVDPRDMISGTYVALSYKISNPTNGSCKNLLQKTKRAKTIYVKLIKTKTLDLSDKKAHIYEAKTCSLIYP
ncbi:MAG: GDYXXLXY domain-containing protein, partial [Elusimicrobiales bacterium]|nr:GDYXXLXY domain-containing protein [Elusimicrobiales bacterium]